MRKADLLSILIVMGFLAILVIGGLLFGGIFHELGSGLKDSVEGSDLSGDARTNALEFTEVLTTDAPNYADNFMFWFLIAIILGMFLTGLFLEFEPAIVIILFFVGTLAVGLSTFVANFYDELMTDPSIAGSGAYTLSSAVFGVYLPAIIFVTFVLTLIIMYSRKGGSRNGF